MAETHRDLDALLPQHWRRYPDSTLRELQLEWSGESDLHVEVHDYIQTELAERAAIRTDARTAEMLGAPWLEPS